MASSVPHGTQPTINQHITQSACSPLAARTLSISLSVNLLHAITLQGSALKTYSNSKRNIRCWRIFSRRRIRNCYGIFKTCFIEYKDYYYILRETGELEPILIEYGFIDNPTDYKFLQNNLL